MSNRIEIHETAFVTSTYRASEENISKDIYAKLWNNKKTDQWIADYAETVSRHDPFLHCLRNRYFYDKISELAKQNQIEVLINFGSGFSMYPFLLGEDLINIEIDKPDIVQYKKKRIQELQSNGQLPSREIHYIGTDFNKDYEEKLISEINAIKKDKTSFILIEGVLFFLNRDDTKRLFQLFGKIQNSGDYVGSVSYTEAIEEVSAFKKLISFFEEKVVPNERFEYQTISNSFYHNIEGYRLEDHMDCFELAAKYASHKKQMDREEVLDENMYLLKKQ
ncbi:adenosine deaminase [Leptobacterium flavescens]|uniref:Adenosine deaminase n=1 Tax=Leptobacterium flavescens TaxID=472055 RepID=A0A6P0UV38_9FLAO|nr:class I SAM-dependent methyltransferase [Leptobacterium flavescens]NER14683.1 adenosine deaminase [Leptobacterium flavescens]